MSFKLMPRYLWFLVIGVPNLPQQAAEKGRPCWVPLDSKRSGIKRRPRTPCAANPNRTGRGSAMAVQTAAFLRLGRQPFLGRQHHSGPFGNLVHPLEVSCSRFNDNGC